MIQMLSLRKLLSGKHLLIIILGITFGYILYLRQNALAASFNSDAIESYEERTISEDMEEISDLTSSAEKQIHAIAQKKLDSLQTKANEYEATYVTWSPFSPEINRTIWQMRETKGTVAFLYAKRELIAALKDEDNLNKLQALITNYSRNPALHCEASPELIYYGLFALGAAAKERGLESLAGITQQLAKDLDGTAQLSKEMLESRENDLYDLVWQSSRHILKGTSPENPKMIEKIAQFLDEIGIAEQRWSKAASEQIYSALCRGMETSNKKQCMELLEKNLSGIETKRK